MWNRIASNRILDKKRKQEAQRKHVENLRNIKSQLNNSAPKHFLFLDTRPKARQLQLERKVQIDSQNSLLVQKMMNTTSYIKPKEDIYIKDSLNSTYCRKVEKQIDQNNQQLVRRLQRASSQYSQRGMSKSIRAYTKVKTNMANSRMDQFYDFQNGFRSTQFQNGKVRPYSAKR